LIISGLVGYLSAQGGHYLPDKVGTWERWRTSCDGSGHQLTAEQNRIYSEKLYRLSEAIHQAQVFNPPMGIVARPTGCVNATMEFLDDYPAAPTGPVPGYLMVGTFSYAVVPSTGKTVVADEGPHFFVDVNSLVRLYSTIGETAHDEQGKIFVAPEIARTESGFPLYKSGSIVITRIPRPIFQPVSAERFLLARIRQAQAELADYQKRHQDFVGAKEEKRLQDTYQRIRARNPQDAEKFLASAQQADRHSDQTLTDLEQKKSGEIEGYRAELASLTPEQRNTQAYATQIYNGPPKGRLLANAGQPGAWPLVCFNPDFFDRSRPRTDFQSLVVGRIYDAAYREKSYDPQYQRIIDFRKTFDFQTLLPLLDQ
jgi:hypothetical protein